jgi:hypothetical protein
LKFLLTLIDYSGVNSSRGTTRIGTEKDIQVRIRDLVRLTFLFSSLAARAPFAEAYTAPEASQHLLAGHLAESQPLNEDYRLQFVACDSGVRGIGAKDHFHGHSLRLRRTLEDRQYYLCSRDPSNVSALLKLRDGAVFWDSKMALDVDGSWAAWNGVPGATDLKETSYKWRNVSDKRSRAAQVDPDRIPFVVMPMAGLARITGTASTRLGKEFSTHTGIRLGDMGVVIYRDRWTPVFVADGGPFMRLGEGSSRVFEAIGASRCKRWNADKTQCIGNGAYPYRNFGLAREVLFIIYPGSASDSITADNAIETLCTFAKNKLQLTGGAVCS